MFRYHLQLGTLVRGIRTAPIVYTVSVMYLFCASRRCKRAAAHDPHMHGCDAALGDVEAWKPSELAKNLNKYAFGGRMSVRPSVLDVVGASQSAEDVEGPPTDIHKLKRAMNFACDAIQNEMQLLFVKPLSRSETKQVQLVLGTLIVVLVVVGTLLLPRHVNACSRSSGSDTFATHGAWTVDVEEATVVSDSNLSSSVVVHGLRETTYLLLLCMAFLFG